MIGRESGQGRRSRYYYELLGRFDDKTEHALAQALRSEAGKHPSFGARRLMKYVRRKAAWHSLGLRRTSRVMKAAGIARKRRRYPIRTTNSAHGFRRYPTLSRRCRFYDQIMSGSPTSRILFWAGVRSSISPWYWTCLRGQLFAFTIVVIHYMDGMATFRIDA